MANERKTETFVRETLRAYGYFTDGSLTIEEQRSDNPRMISSSIEILFADSGTMLVSSWMDADASQENRLFTSHETRRKSRL
jgi:hypothetical protein